jgi:hypothetical protein
LAVVRVSVGRIRGSVSDYEVKPIESSSSRLELRSQSPRSPQQFVPIMEDGTDYDLFRAHHPHLPAAGRVQHEAAESIVQPPEYAKFPDTVVIHSRCPSLDWAVPVPACTHSVIANFADRATFSRGAVSNKGQPLMRLGARRRSGPPIARRSNPRRISSPPVSRR